MEEDSQQVWLVERTYSDDEQNLIILIYATLDGTQYYRKERALTSFSDSRKTTAAVKVDSSNLGNTADNEVQDQYKTEAQRMSSKYNPDDEI